MLYVGLDIHDKRIAICALGETGQIVRRAQGCTIDEMMRILEGLPDRFEVCYEASWGSGHYHATLKTIREDVHHGLDVSPTHHLDGKRITNPSITQNSAAQFVFVRRTGHRPPVPAGQAGQPKLICPAMASLVTRRSQDPHRPKKAGGKEG